MTAASDSDFLQGMAQSSLARSERAVSMLSESELNARLVDVFPPAPLELSTEQFDLIAEVKRRSPAEGQLSNAQLAPEEQARSYIDGGAVAISVLTEPDRFAGSLGDLTAISAQIKSVPVMRKDFLVRPYQVREARLAGASGVLLIAAILDAAELEHMLSVAFELNMFALVEAFDQPDLDKALPVLESVGAAMDGPRARYLLGINCRDLRSLQVDFDHFLRMAGSLPDDVPAVAESGLKTPAQAHQLAHAGYRLALAGTTLMKSDNPRQTVAALLKAGRA